VTRGSLIAALLAALGALLPGSAPVPGPDRAATAPDAAARSAILISIDSLRADHLALYGYPRETTPQLDALLARRGGTVYRRATAVSPSCHPSHTAMLTGLYPQEVGVPWCGEDLIVNWAQLEQPDDRAELERYQDELREQPPALRRKKLSAVRNWLTIPADQPTVQGILHAAGLRTFGAASIWTLQARFGYAAGFDRYVDDMPEYYGPRSLTWLLRDTMGSQRRRATAATIDDAIGFLRGLGAGERYFLFLNLADAHVPYAPRGDTTWSADSADRAAMESFWSRRYPAGLWPRARQAMSSPDGFLLDRYDDAIHQVDAQLGRLFAELERRGDLGRTLLVVTADHGDGFGQHTYLSATQSHRLFFEHSVYLWEETVHVPLVVFAPSDRGGVRHRDVNVSQVDLEPTLLAALGLARSAPTGPGSPLPSLPEEDRTVYFLTFGRGRPGLLSSVHLDYPKFVGVRHGDLKFFVDRERFRHAGAGRCFLYDLASDPNELHNLCPERPGQAAGLRAELVEWYARTTAGRAAERRVDTPRR
jgi:arylsulfatase A-like enzyme